MITKNGKAYDSSDVVITLLGNTPTEVFEMTYSTEREHQLNYSLGSRKPTSWSQGKDSSSGSITMSLKDCAAVESAAKKAGLSSILDIPPFDIIVSFVNEFDALIQDRVTCKFMSTGRQIGGDMSLRYQYNLFVLDVQQNKGL